MHSKKFIRGIAQTLILASCISSSVVNAQPSSQSGEKRGPPPEALEACADQTEGEACSFSGRRGDVTGSCMASPNGDDELACAPEGGPPGGDHEK